MADNTIALQVQTPNTFQTLGNVLNVASGLQTLQQQKQQIGLTGIELQAKEQANKERQALIDWKSNPNNFMTNGMVDLDKVNSVVPKIAPQTAPAVIADFTKLAHAQTDAAQAKLNFTGSERAIVGGLYGVMGRAGVTDPAEVSAELDRLKTQYPDSPALTKYIDAAKIGLENVPAGANLPKVLITQSQSLLNPEAQQSGLTPSVGMVNTGGTIQPVVTTPSVAGAQPSVAFPGGGLAATVPPTQRQTQAQDALGRPVILNRDLSGNVSYSAPQGGDYRPLMQLPPGETAQTGQELFSARKIAQDAAVAAPSEHFNNQQILALSPDAFTGTGSEGLAKVLNAVGLQRTNDAGADTKRLQHFLALQTENSARAMGANTDQARQLASEAVLPSNSPEKAIKNITKINDAYVTGAQLFYQGLQDAINNPSNTKDIFAMRPFQAAWAQNFDPNAMRLYNAQQSGDKAEAAEIVKEMGGVNSPQFKTLVRKMQNLEALSRGRY